MEDDATNDDNESREDGVTDDIDEWVFLEFCGRKNVWLNFPISVDLIAINASMEMLRFRVTHARSGGIWIALEWKGCLEEHGIAADVNRELKKRKGKKS